MTRVVVADSMRSEELMVLDPPEEDFSQLFTSSPDLLCVAGTDGYFQRLNPAWERTLGFTIEELFAKPYLDFVHPEDRNRTRAEAGRLFDEGETNQFENRYACADGSYKWLQWSATVSPERELMYAVARDITAHRNTKDTLQRAREQAERANSAKSAFLANMSHELRTPMTTIVASSQILQDQVFGQLNPKQTHYLDNILLSSEHMLHLVNQLLDISKVEAGRLTLVLEEFDIATVLSELKGQFASVAAKKRIVCETSVEPDVRSITADRTRFNQIMYNLLSNAIKFTPEGGCVRVAVSRGSADHAGSTVIAVSDTGIGISEDDQPRVFRRFEQAESPYARLQQGTGLGTGLGLPLAKQLVELHGGRIWVESAGEGNGSTFRFTMPGDGCP